MVAALAEEEDDDDGVLMGMRVCGSLPCTAREAMVVLIPCAQRKNTKDVRSCQSMPTPNSLSPLSIPLSLPIVSSPASSFIRAAFGVAVAVV